MTHELSASSVQLEIYGKSAAIPSIFRQVSVHRAAVADFDHEDDQLPVLNPGDQSVVANSVFP